MVRVLIQLFITAHGLLYLLYFVPNSDPKWPFDLKKGWFYASTGETALTIGKLLVVVSAILFVVGSLGLFLQGSSRQYGQFILIAAAISALILQLLFWKNELIIGLLINIAVIYILLKTKLLS